MSEESAAADGMVGWGFDAHALNDQPPLVLGGVEVSDEVGVDATSDGDVLAHAITDAILGACVLGDMGEHFPPHDPMFEGVESMFFVRQAATMAMAADRRLVHVDATVIAQSVRIAPHREKIRETLAEGLGVGAESVSVKATTTDGLGLVGRGEGIAAVAVVSVAPLS